jgi:hypothetical protein
MSNENVICLRVSSNTIITLKILYSGAVEPRKKENDGGDYISSRTCALVVDWL